MRFRRVGRGRDELRIKRTHLLNLDFPNLNYHSSEQTNTSTFQQVPVTPQGMWNWLPLGTIKITNIHNPILDGNQLSIWSSWLIFPSQHHPSPPPASPPGVRRGQLQLVPQYYGVWPISGGGVRYEVGGLAIRKSSTWSWWKWRLTEQSFSVAFLWGAPHPILGFENH